MTTGTTSAIAGLASAMLLALPAAPSRAEPAACVSARAAIDQAAAATMTQGSPGMIVAAAREGAPLLVRAYGHADLEHDAAMTPDAVFRMASLTKQFTAAAVLALHEEGKLSLDDPLSRHLPAQTRVGRITLRQLLVQTSGIPDYAETPEVAGWNAGGRTREEMLVWIERLAETPAFAPGTKWQYSNSNYVLLGAVIERVSGEPLAAFFARRLFRPAGLTATAFDVAADVVPGRVRGYRKSKAAPSAFANAETVSYTIPGAAGGLRTTAMDLLRWSDALWSGRVIGRESVRTMAEAGRLADGRTTKLGMPAEWQKGLNADYAMGLFVSPTAHGRRLWHSGSIAGFETWMAHYPERRVTIAMMENSESADLDTSAIERAVFALVDGGCSAEAPAQISASSASLPTSAGGSEDTPVASPPPKSSGASAASR